MGNTPNQVSGYQSIFGGLSGASSTFDKLLGGYLTLEIAKAESERPLQTQVEVAHQSQERFQQQVEPMQYNPELIGPNFMSQRSALGISNGAALAVAGGLLALLVVLKS